MVIAIQYTLDVEANALYGARLVRLVKTVGKTDYW